MVLALFKHMPIWIRGGGDLASGVIYRLHKVGFPVIVAELPAPSLVRRTVAFGTAIYEGRITVEGITAIHVTDLHQPRPPDTLPVIIDADGDAMRAFAPPVVVDARMMKHPLDCRPTDASLVIALGPGYLVGRDCHAIIETNRGHNLGRVYWQGSAEPDTGEPGAVKGFTHSRVLRAPITGHVHARYAVGDHIRAGDTIAIMNDDPQYAIVAPFDGVLRGIVHPAVHVPHNQKIGDLDPRAKPEHCTTISDKSLAIGGGVLEAILSAPHIHHQLHARTSSQ